MRMVLLDEYSRSGSLITSTADGSDDLVMLLLLSVLALPADLSAPEV